MVPLVPALVEDAPRLAAGLVEAHRVAVVLLRFLQVGDPGVDVAHPQDGHLELLFSDSTTLRSTVARRDVTSQRHMIRVPVRTWHWRTRDLQPWSAGFAGPPLVPADGACCGHTVRERRSGRAAADDPCARLGRTGGESWVRPGSGGPFGSVSVGGGRGGRLFGLSTTPPPIWRAWAARARRWPGWPGQGCRCPAGSTSRPRPTAASWPPSPRTSTPPTPSARRRCSPTRTSRQRSPRRSCAPTARSATACPSPYGRRPRPRTCRTCRSPASRTRT